MDRHQHLNLTSRFDRSAPQQPQLLRSMLVSTPRDRLFDLARDVPDLLCRAEAIQLESARPDHAAILLQVIDVAQRLDLSLTEWLDTLPPDYSFTLVPVLEPITISNIDEAWIWPGVVHIYHDLFIAHLLNQYRTLRLYLSTVIMDCSMQAMAFSADALYQGGLSFDHLEAIQNLALYRLCSLIDDVCASVPFHLGIPPAASPDYYGVRTKMSTAAMGGYFLIRPLFVASQVQCIPPLQRRWIRGRLKAIADFGFSQATILSQDSKSG